MKRVVVLAALAASCNPPDDAVEPAPDAAAELPPVEPRVFGNQQKLLPNVGGNSTFGHAIGLGGDRLVISGRLDGTQATQAGALYVFAKAGPAFTLEQKVFAGDPIAGLMLGKSVAISGHTMIAGGTGFGAAGPVDGAAYIFTRTGATWAQQQKLTVADAAPQARFGQTVQIEGETAVVGAPNDGVGSVYVFVRDRTTTWTQQQKLTSPDGVVGDRFGYYHAISGNTLIVGARGHASNAGAAYVFVRSGTTWSFQQKLTAGDAPANAQFGRAVAIDGNTAVVGAWQAASAGAAYVFVRSGSTWSQQQKLTASDLQGGDEYGSAVAIRRDVAVIGSKKDDDNGGQSGSVYIYKRSGTTWTEDQKIKPVDAAQVEDRFGQALAFNGTDLVIGAYLDDQVAPDAGAAYAFDQPPAEVVRNGSFETGDYAGWTLLDDVSPTAGTYGIATDQETIPLGGLLFDFAHSLLVQVFSPGFTRTFSATDGTFVAFHVQNEVANHRMFQDVQVPACNAVLRWDMEYTNHGAFDPVEQFSAVHVRNPTTDAILATLFKTDAATPTTVSPMTAFEAPLTGFEGQQIRLDFEHVVHHVHCDIAWDNVRIVCLGPAPQIAVAPSPHDFGNQRAGTTSANQIFTITNTGTADLVINSISTAPPFQVTPGALPATIAPGANRTFTARFAPAVTGPASGTISIASNAAGSPAVVAVTGTGTAPAIGVSPGSHDFGPRRVGIASPAQIFTITNTGTAPLTITSTTTTGPFAAGATSTTLAPSASQTVAVTFTPTVTGAAAGTLVIAHDAAGSPTTIPLTGSGIAPAISVAPSPLSFGSQRVGTTSAPQTLTVSNPGSDTLLVQQITTTGPFSTPNTAFAVAPGASTNIVVAFTPGAAGAAAGSIVIAHDAAGGSTTVNATGTGIQPAISPSVTQLDFGDQRVGSTGAPKTFTIENTGSDTLTVSSLSASLPFATSTALPIVLAPSATSTISLTFSPTAAGVANATLSIVSDAPTSPTLIDLTGRGVEPVIDVVSSLDFGAVRVGTPANRVVTIDNAGTSDLTITGVATNTPYSNADTFPIVIAAGTTADVTITFTPPATGVATGQLSIASDAATSPTTIILTGLGVEPVVGIDTTPIDFGLQRVGVTSPSRFVVITNTGAFPLAVTSISTAAPFAVITATSFTLQASESAAVEITFTPATEGIANDTLTIAHDAGPATTIPLAGTGTVAELDASPSALVFGDIRVGTTSATQPVTVRNLGLAPLAITSISASAGFVASGLTLPRNVLPGASVTFEVAFAPAAAGASSGSIEIVTSAGTSTVTLDATAVTAALTADLTSLDLGSVAVGEASAVQIVTLTNVTDAPISVAGAVASDPQFVFDPSPSQAPVPPGGTVAFGVRFVPAAAGAASGQIDVTLAGSTITEVSVQLAGQGQLEDAGGCCSTSGSGGSSLLLGFAVLGMLRRRPGASRLRTNR